MKFDIEAKNQQRQQVGDVELPAWVGRLLRLIYLGAGLFLLASSLTLLGCSSAGADQGELSWQPAAEVLSPERIQDIITAHSSALSEAEQEALVQSMQVADLGAGLKIVDFNHPLLQGRLGALYVIYGPQGERIFSRYLSQQLPEGIPVVQRSPRQQGQDPCLVINRLHQSLTDQQAIAQTTLCYDGATWLEANTAVVDESQF
jgi:hypothetical protein